MVGFDEDSKIPELLRLGSRIAILPVIHGSGQFALTVRRWMLEESFDCVAVPLPDSFRLEVERAVLELPRPSVVFQRPNEFGTSTSFEDPVKTEGDGWQMDAWRGDDESDDDLEAITLSYVPIDPCQSVIMAIRAAMGEHIPRAYIDLETNSFRPYATVMPDPFVVRHVAPEKFAAAVLPNITRPPDAQTRGRMIHMAARLRELQTRYQRILFVTSVLHWPWIREAYNQLGGDSDAGYDSEPGQTPLDPDDKHASMEVPQGSLPEQQDSARDSRSSFSVSLPEHDQVLPPTRYAVKARTLMFLFGELPL